MPKDLFYRPELRIERNYRSDAEKQKDFAIESLEEREEPEDLLDSVDDVFKVLSALPESLQNIITPSLEEIRKDIASIPEKYRVNNYEDQESESAPSLDESLEAERSPEEESGEAAPPSFSFLPKDTDLVTIVREEKKPAHSIIEENYHIDRVDIYKDFVDKIGRALERYLRAILYSARKGGFNSFKDLLYGYNIPSDKLPKDAMHIGDDIVRSQIIREQNSRSLRKLYNIDHTIFHLRSNVTTKELRKRYYQEAFTRSNTYLSTKRNDNLRKSRQDYDRRYEASMYNFYKYLNGASIMIEEVLQAFSFEAEKKAILNQEGVDVLSENKKIAEEVKKIRVKQKREYEARKTKETKQFDKRKSRLEQAGKKK